MTLFFQDPVPVSAGAGLPGPLALEGSPHLQVLQACNRGITMPSPASLSQTLPCHSPAPISFWSRLTRSITSSVIQLRHYVPVSTYRFGTVVPTYDAGNSLKLY